MSTRGINLDNNKKKREREESSVERQKKDWNKEHKQNKKRKIDR